MLVFESFIFMFGGIQDITKEKNDVYIFNPSKSQWNKIHTSTNSIYDCSPTLKKEKKVFELFINRVQIKTQIRLNLSKCRHKKDQKKEVMQ